MKAVFIALYALHPGAPLIFAVVIANGLLAPAIYTWRRGIPYDIGAIKARSKGADSFAKYAYRSWLAFAVLAFAVVVLIALEIFFK